MSRIARSALHRMLDSEPDYAVVRCRDGDESEFWRLVCAAAMEDDWLGERVPDELVQVVNDSMDEDPRWVAFVRANIEAPQWRWYRINPAGPNLEGYRWWLGYPEGAGPGNWRGSIVRSRPSGGGS